MMSAALDSFAPSIAHLRTIATPVTEYRVLPFGVDEIDSRLGAGGLRAGALHEATAQSAALVDDAATTLFSDPEFAWLRKKSYVFVYAEANFIKRSSTASSRSPTGRDRGCGPRRHTFGHHCRSEQGSDGRNASLAAGGSRSRHAGATSPPSPRP